jgi:hypothetical protein
MESPAPERLDSVTEKVLSDVLAAHEERFVVTFCAAPGVVPAAIRPRQLLKIALRRFQLRAASVGRA